MSTMGIAIGATALSLLLVFIWLMSLSLRKQRVEEERKAREVAYRKAIEKARKQEKQERLFKAETGHLPSILFLAKEAERTNLKEALYWYEKAAQLDDMNGMYGIVRISMRKREDLILKEQANFWQLAIAGLEGDLNAKFEMGKALIFGRGTTKNIPKGYSLIEESASAGNPEAMIFMGDWNVDKTNPDASAEASVKWYKGAADKGKIEGNLKLGASYLNGVGVPKNHGIACYWLESAAEKSHPEAMCRAGEAWRDQGEHGNAISYIWLFMAAHFGYEPARPVRDIVGSNLGVDSVVGLQSLAKPLIAKLTQKSVTKHSIIRALNKLYKRGVPIPKKVVEVEEDSDDKQQEASPIQESSQPNSEVQQDLEGREQAVASVAVEPTIPTAALDFSQPLKPPKP
ncbi:tetratricopeptide repeat protein [Vibrio sp. 99-70-13A1]|uniref:tetratricopeptide repeat protein n=1 Tax=Vibrio sp. 99-70-13A1 TaxID=2607601 RepID=UPI001493C69D|nr:tetratricopeptide repeat protein [Vibrio sp. 99-70-13A1]NOH97183.1 sel1 repeat family protein [Vibrio sp. 99-70-13A1]